MRRFLKNYEIGEPFFLRNLVLAPVLAKTNGGDGYMVLEQAIQSKSARIFDRGNVNTVELDYLGDQPLFIMEGEEILGALQNRVVNTSVVVEEPHTVHLPVVCVEKGRWSGNSQFRESQTVAYPSLRAILASSVYESLKTRHEFSANQSQIWQSVDQTLKSLQVHSATQSMHDAYQTMEEEIGHYLEYLEDVDDRMAGFIAVVGGEVIGTDVFGSPALFQKVREKAARGYIIEALTRRFQTSPLVTRDFVTDFWESLQRRRYEAYPAVAHGKEYRFKRQGWVARGLVVEDQMVHFSAFPVPTGG